MPVVLVPEPIPVTVMRDDVVEHLGGCATGAERTMGQEGSSGLDPTWTVVRLVTYTEAVHHGSGTSPGLTWMKGTASGIGERTTPWDGAGTFRCYWHAPMLVPGEGRRQTSGKIIPRLPLLPIDNVVNVYYSVHRGCGTENESGPRGSEMMTASERVAQQIGMTYRVNLSGNSECACGHEHLTHLLSRTNQKYMGACAAADCDCTGEEAVRALMAS